MASTPNPLNRGRMSRTGYCAFVQFTVVAANYAQLLLKSHRGALSIGVTVLGLYVTLIGQTLSTFGTIVEGKLIVGLADKSQRLLERSEVAKLPHQTVKVKDSGGRHWIYSGVSLTQLFEYVGVGFNNQQTPANLSSVVVVESVDAPSTIFAMAEFDTALTSKQILLADSKDGKPLVLPEGPFRIVVPDEKQPTRWVKQVWAIYIVRMFEPAKRP